MMRIPYEWSVTAFFAVAFLMNSTCCCDKLNAQQAVVPPVTVLLELGEETLDSKLVARMTRLRQLIEKELQVEVIMESGSISSWKVNRLLNGESTSYPELVIAPSDFKGMPEAGLRAIGVFHESGSDSLVPGFASFLTSDCSTEVAERMVQVLKSEEFNRQAIATNLPRASEVPKDDLAQIRMRIEGFAKGRESLLGEVGEIRRRLYKFEAQKEICSKKIESAKARTSHLAEKLRELDSVVNEVKESNSGTIERGGRSVSAEQIQAIVDATMQIYKNNQEALDQLEADFAVINESQESLEQLDREGNEGLELLAQKIQMLQSKVVAVADARQNQNRFEKSLQTNNSIKRLLERAEQLELTLDELSRSAKDK